MIASIYTERKKTARYDEEKIANTGSNMRLLTSSEEVYRKVESNTISVLYTGIVLYRKEETCEKSIRRLIEDYGNERIDFDEFLGSFRIVLEDKTKKVSMVFGDNSGSLGLFYDKKGDFFADRLSLAMNELNKEPNFDSIADFFQFGCIYSLETIIKGVERTDPFFYYTVRDNSIRMHSKSLENLDQPSRYKNLHELIGQLLEATGKEKIGVIITGGTDSRAVLSNVFRHKNNLELFLSGDDEDRDVQIASEISKILDLPFFPVKGKIDSEEYLEEALKYSDYCGSPLVAGRLFRLYEFIKSRGINSFFGGVGGEFYKNSFINQDFPFYFGKMDLPKFFRIKIPTEKVTEEGFGELINKPIRDTYRRVMRYVSGGEEGFSRNIKSQCYINFGVKILSSRYFTTSNSLNYLCNSVQPLLEREAIKLVFQKSPYLVEMQRYQRNEVTTNCPNIANVKTDRGLNVSNSSLSLLKDTFRNYHYLIRIFCKRIKGKAAINHSLEEARRIVFDSNVFKKAFASCQEIGVISNKIPINQIESHLIEKVLLIGSCFN